MSAIHPDTIQAYRETDYRVFAPHPFTLHIARLSESLRAFYRLHGVTRCAFITACNPYSLPLSEEANAERQRELAQELRTLGLTFFPGAGVHPTETWPEEASFLVLGLTLADAKKLGEKYEQNAIVWCGPDAKPELVLLR